MERIKNLLMDKYDNHIMPFLWMHGEDKETIETYIEKIYQSGVKSFCIESRPYEEFLQKKWWSDLAFIIEAAEKRGMTFWILDDKHFPTGYAAGEIEKHHPSLQKMLLDFKQFDWIGPKKNAGFILDWVTVGARPNIMNVGVDKEDAPYLKEQQTEIISIVAAKKKGFNEIFEEEWIDLYDFVENDTLYWDIPEGEWSIFIFYTTYEGGEAATQGYLNPLLPEATDVLLQTVYDTHYQHFNEKFGTTIKGFFSDEPRFGNIKGPDASIGRKDMPLPWRPDLLHLLASYLGYPVEKTRGLLPLLFRGDNKEAHLIRFQYMKLVTDLYRTNFTEKIGKWCKLHGAEYIGHVIEDNNANSRLGYGAGHFFKSMAGQDMAGIDVVLHQLMPNYNNGYFRSMTTTGWDGEFFHYLLGKMGASLGELDPLKNGRTMCELFGAYGWSEGTKLMKWLADHMLVRGVNYFVPHAFSMKKFPDTDCPPHFYADGNDLEFQALHILMTYMNRLGYLFSEGLHLADIAVLYNGEAEWSGDYLPLQKVTRELMENQFEFDVVSSEMIIDAELASNKFTISKHTFKTIIVPFSERLPAELLTKLAACIKSGIPVLFVNGFPKAASEAIDVSNALTIIKKSGRALSLLELTSELSKATFDQLRVDIALPYLRYYHYEQEGKSVYMLFNESDQFNIAFQADFPTKRKLSGYDPLQNKTFVFSCENGHYPIQLAKSESLILFEADEKAPNTLLIKQSNEKVIQLTNNHWNLSFNGFGLSPNLKEKSYSKLPVLGVGDKYSHFSGTICYTTKVDKYTGNILLELENASEVVSVYVNHTFIATRISTPYVFDLTGMLPQSSNELRIEIINNLGRNQRDYLSQYLLLEPLGISGDVKLRIMKEENQ